MKEQLAQLSLKDAIRTVALRKYGTQRAAAKAWGVTEAVVSHVVQGYRGPTQPMIRDVDEMIANA